MLQQTEQAAEQAAWLQCAEESDARQREESMVMRDALVVAESIRQREGANDALSQELMRANDQLATYMDEACRTPTSTTTTTT